MGTISFPFAGFLEAYFPTRPYALCKEFAIFRSVQPASPHPQGGWKDSYF